MMNNNDGFDFSDGNLLLSCELLYLLQHLVENEPEALRGLVAKAVQGGYKHNPIASHDYVEVQVTDPNIQQSIVEFLGLMDSFLFEAHQEQDVKRHIHKNAIPALNQIDSKVCDEETVQMSLEKTSTQLCDKPEESAQDILLKELLKQWKPIKKTIN